jgi:cyclopropane fatty-acyl-phospholipid synthase-like methyltransferase
MRVLDLCCGNCSSSLFLAKQFRVRVTALDRDVDPTDNRERIKAAGLQDSVIPVKMDARSIGLPEEYFDAVFCLNSYFYFGADSRYLPYLTRFLRPRGRIGIASPCYSRELTVNTPEDFLYDAPHFTESFAVHSPPWWQQHFRATGVVKVLACEEHPRGREFWLDHVRWLLEQHHPRDMDHRVRQMVFREIVMLLKDKERFVTYMTLIAERRSS